MKLPTILPNAKNHMAINVSIIRDRVHSSQLARSELIGKRISISGNTPINRKITRKAVSKIFLIVLERRRRGIEKQNVSIAGDHWVIANCCKKDRTVLLLVLRCNRLTIRLVLTQSGWTSGIPQPVETGPVNGTGQ